MKKKDYQNPTIKIVRLQSHCRLMAGSGGPEKDKHNGGGMPGGQEGETF